jgi:channel protein (hemolysin III family)
MKERAQSLGEEIANSVSHGVALLVAMAGVPYLIHGAWPLGVTSLVGTAVFATATVLLYLASTLYHALPTGRAKRVFLKLDHGAIYLLIAGSYPPFTLGAAPGWWARVYRGRRILHAGFSVALRACRVAQLRRSRHRLSLLRGAGLLSMTLSSTPAHCPALVITMCNPGHPGWDQSARDCRCSTNAPVSRFLGTSGFGKP